MNAKSALSKVSQDEINWARQNSIFKAQRDYNTGMQNAEKRGLEQGLQQGEHNARLEMVQRMLSEGFSAEQTARITQFSLDEVLHISTEHTEPNN